MNEERLMEKIQVLQKLVTANQIEAPLAGPGDHRIPISKMDASRLIDSVYMTDNGSIDVTMDDNDTVILAVEYVVDPLLETCSACNGSGHVRPKQKRRRRSEQSLTKMEESLFWTFIQERQQIYDKRQAGESKPWTDDPILQRHRFTNVFREQDAGTVWMREHLTRPNEDKPWREIVGNCAYYRMFNLIATGEFLGWVAIWDTNQIIKRLTERQTAGNPIFTNAHMVRGEFGKPKVETVCTAVSDVYERADDIVNIARDKGTLQSVFEELIKVKSVGGFVAYEIVTDLRHTPVLANASDIMTWANVGPGAARGLKRLGLDALNGVEAMRGLLSKARGGALPPDFPAMELRDIEHCLCEVDKYARAKFGEEGRLRPYDATGA